MKACAPHVYAQTYGSTSPANDALCASEAQRLCMNLPSALDNTNPGVVDPAACTAAIMGSCSQYLQNSDQPVAACLPNTGKLAKDQGCLADAQCGSGLSCYVASGIPGCTSYCGPVGKVGTQCGYTSPGSNDRCDPRSGIQCVSQTASGFFCAQVTYVSGGSACDYPYGTHQCQSGYACSTKSKNCVPLLTEGQACTAGMLGTNPEDPCDARLGLSCQLTDLSMPAGGSTCQAAYVVPVGATCGPVQDANGKHNHVCDSYSYCNSQSICTAKQSMLNGVCTAAGGCYPPYVCNSGGVCAAPTTMADPTCTVPADPTSALECGITPGGLPLVCSQGVCCVSNPTATSAGPVGFGCSASNACGGSSITQLGCNDSAQCGTGQLCCTGYHPSGNPVVTSTCMTATACPGFDWELCRMDDPNPCPTSGGTCHSTAAASTWSSYLPPNVGFCSVNASKLPGQGGCDAPGDGCSSNGNCCSNSCDGTMNACN
jgi:hypothetical protein